MNLLEAIQRDIPDLPPCREARIKLLVRPGPIIEIGFQFRLEGEEDWSELPGSCPIAKVPTLWAYVVSHTDMLDQVYENIVKRYGDACDALLEQKAGLDRICKQEVEWLNDQRRIHCIPERPADSEGSEPDFSTVSLDTNSISQDPERDSLP